ncbi:zinc finger protein JACKDAW [Trifolium pratense]|uniref:Uncharacterized protein n=3 Tax=Trifolium pratense TaxID=57577 RepID=A0ACB0IJU7_TRIPR|nr:zinc finger protein JACKDAW [Trifolium pratense]CAJ2632624.1 unnamed protein product [Trifolium pratense]
MNILGDPFSLSSSTSGFDKIQNPNPNPPQTNKKKRNLPGTPDPDAEVIALSPKTLMATNRFVCEICNKGFQRDQNLQLHRRGHNLPWKLKQRSNKEPRKKVYICPEKTCVHHDAARALGDLTGIKKHFSRKHGEKKWKCDKCSKKYAVQSDWKAHTKTCGTREYKCDCGTLFSRKDSFITHRAFCDALAEESARQTSLPPPTTLNFKNEESNMMNNQTSLSHNGLLSCQGLQNLPQFNTPHNALFHHEQRPNLSLWLNQENQQMNHQHHHQIQHDSLEDHASSSFCDVMQMTQTSTAPMSATALLQKAAQMGSTRSSTNPSIFNGSFGLMSSSSTQTNNSTLNQNHDEVNMVINQNMKQHENYNNAAMVGNGNSSNGFRDFLGVSNDHPHHSFLPQELAKFASMTSSMMSFNQFNA